MMATCLVTCAIADTHAYITFPFTFCHVSQLALQQSSPIAQLLREAPSCAIFDQVVLTAGLRQLDAMGYM